MRIIIDAMGGDNAPEAIVKGAVDAQREFGVDIVLVGRETDVKRCLAAAGAETGEHLAVVNADEVIDMHDDPSTAVRRKKQSSMAVALDLLHAGEGDAVISAGSTGALLTGATLKVKRIRGIRRAAMAPVLPNGGRGTVLCKEAYALLREAGEAGRLNFIGNVEGTDVFSGKADVIVTDGFSGNIMLKTAEGTIKFLMKNIKGCLTASFSAKLGALLVKKNLGKLKKMMDVSEVGGTAFLGIQRPVIKAHGSSDARAVRSAVKQAIAFVQADFITEIENNIDYMRLRGEEQDK